MSKWLVYENSYSENEQYSEEFDSLETALSYSLVALGVFSEEPTISRVSGSSYQLENNRGYIRIIRREG